MGLSLNLVVLRQQGCQSIRETGSATCSASGISLTSLPESVELTVHSYVS
jgi:hypothetical protein